MNHKFALLAACTAALLLGACSSGSSSTTTTDTTTTTDNSGAASPDANGAAATPNSTETSDPMAAEKAVFLQMVAAEDNDFVNVIDVKSRKTVGTDAEYTTKVGFSQAYPCTVGKHNDSSPVWGYCIVGSNASQSDADSNFAAAKQLVTTADSTLQSVTPTVQKDANDIADAQYANDAHAVYVLETKQNGRFVTKITFAKPAALK